MKIVNRKLSIFVFVLITIVFGISNASHAQVTQYGRVVELNSYGQTLPGVLVTVPSTVDCPSAISDANGVFKLVFVKNQPGDVIRGMRVKKDGYEVVNHLIAQEGWILAGIDTLTIVMAPEGMVSVARSRIYDYLEDIYLSRYDSVSSSIQEQYVLQRISDDEFNSGMEKAADDLKRSLQNVNMYADQLARLCPNGVVTMTNQDVSVGSSSEYEMDFLFKGLGFIESCLYFGDYYLELNMNDLAIGYYSLALQMYETLNGFEGSDFTDQIKQLQSAISKIDR